METPQRPNIIALLAEHFGPDAPEQLPHFDDEQRSVAYVWEDGGDAIEMRLTLMTEETHGDWRSYTEGARVIVETERYRSEGDSEQRIISTLLLSWTALRGLCLLGTAALQAHGDTQNGPVPPADSTPGPDAG